MRHAQEIANEWIKCWSGTEPPAIATGEFGESALDWDLPRYQPQCCWEAILAVLEQIEPVTSNKLFQVLAAGPLEDLLVHHGEEFISKIETEAASNQAFNLLLGGVWKNEISPSVWERLQRFRANTW